MQRPTLLVSQQSFDQQRTAVYDPILQMHALRFQLAKRVVLSLIVAFCVVVHAQQTESEDSINRTITSIDEILTLSSLNEQVGALSTMVTLLSEEPVFELSDQIETIVSDDRRRALLGAIFPRVTELNLRRTVERFIELPQEDQFHVVESIYENVSIEDVTDAVRASNAFSLELQEKALLTLLSTTADTSIEQLVQLAKIASTLVTPVIVGLDGFVERDGALSELIEHWSEVDVLMSIELIKKIHSATFDDILLRKSIRVLAREHPAEALRFSQQYFGRFGHTLESIVFITFAEHNPEPAVDMIPTLRPKYFDFLTYEGELSIDKPLFKLGPEYAVEFGRSLSSDDAEQFFWALVDNFCDADVQEYIALEERFPAVESVSYLSHCLLMKSHGKRNLTSEQFDLLHEGLKDEDDLEEIDNYPKADFIRNSPN